MSELRKPAVVVLVLRGRAADIQPVLWGLEEEGFHTTSRSALRVRPLAWRRKAPTCHH